MFLINLSLSYENEPFQCTNEAFNHGERGVCSRAGIEKSLEAYLPEEVSIVPVHGSDTNVQWVFVVQADEDKGNFESVPPHFQSILNAVNLEMIERPALLHPPVKADDWERTTVKCRVQGADRQLVVMSFPAFARYVQEVQNVPYNFWEIVTGLEIRKNLTSQ